MKIREYKLQDKVEILEFTNRLRKETYSASVPNPEDLKNIERSYYCFFIAEENGRIIGTCGLLKSDSCGELKRMYVDKSFRRKGIGKELVNNIFEYAKNHNINKIILFTFETNVAAIELYKKMGFKIANKENDGRIFFEKDL